MHGGTSHKAASSSPTRGGRQPCPNDKTKMDERDRSKVAAGEDYEVAPIAERYKMSTGEHQIADRTTRHQPRQRWRSIV